MKENLKPCAYKLWKCYERCSESVFDEADDPLARSDASEKSDAIASGVALATQLVRAPLPHEETEAKARFPNETRQGEEGSSEQAYRAPKADFEQRLCITAYFL